MNDLLAPERRRDRFAADRTSADASLTIKELVSYRLHVVANLLSRGAAMRYKRDFGVSLWEWRTVALLGAQAPLSLNDLASAAGLDKSQMSRVVAGLVERSLVRRGEDETDGRGVKLSLTRAGEKLYEGLIRAAAERNAAFLGCLTPHERECLAGALQKLGDEARVLIQRERELAAKPSRSKRRAIGRRLA
jgi:DNA-binding MarR family transcriptional regulator